MLTAIHASIAKNNSPVYSDYKNRPATLTEAEQNYFQQTVAQVLAATGIAIPVYMCDQEQFPGSCGDALGIHWRSVKDGDEFITIDNYFIHESYEVAFNGAYDLNNGETLASVICHELAHIRYQRHTKYHAALTAQYVAMVERAA